MGVASRQQVGPVKSLMVLFAGLVLTLGGCFVIRPETISNPAITTGTVVDLEQGTTSGRGTSRRTTYRPVISYEVDGATYTFTEGSATTSPPQVGETVEVEYDTQEPSSARWTGSPTGWMWLVTVAAGVVALAVGVLFLVRHLTRLGTLGAGAAMVAAGPTEDRPFVPPPADPAAQPTGYPTALPTPGPVPPPTPPPPVPPPTSPPPGWYSDPSGSGQRWWDGQAWTAHQR